MRHGARTRFTLFLSGMLLFTLVLAACGGSPGGSTSAQTPAQFYKGKTVQIIVPYSPGGGYDQWARLLAPYLQKYLGAGKVEVVNAPGGGGLVGTNKIYAAAPDGLTIGDTNAGGDVFDQIGNAKGVSFDVNKFTWLGRPDNDPHIIAVHPTGPYQTFADLEHASQPIQALATGAGSSDYNAAVITYNVFGIPYHMVAAFSGSSAEKAAFIRGDGTTVSLSASDVAQIPNQAKVVVLESSRSFEKLPGTPDVVSEATQAGLDPSKIAALTAMANVMDLGHSFVAPPGIPADRVAYLQHAFDQAFADSGLLQQATQGGLYPGYLPGTQVQQMAQQAVANGSALTTLLVAK